MLTDPVALGGRVPSPDLVTRYRAEGYWAGRTLVDHLEAQVASNDDADRLAQALRELPGWRADFPRVEVGTAG